MRRATAPLQDLPAPQVLQAPQARSALQAPLARSARPARLALLALLAPKVTPGLSCNSCCKPL